MADHDTSTLANEDAFIVDETTDEVLRLHLEKFEGPLEVLLYLIKSQEIDIFDIPILKVTEQYLRFIEIMQEENLEVAGDFLVMAATLIQIKSKMLLPPDVESMEEEDFDEEDPRLELVEKLLEYRRYRDVAERLQFLEGERERLFARSTKPALDLPPSDEEEVLEVTLYDLIQAFKGVLRFFSDDIVHNVSSEEASVDDKIEYIESCLLRDGSASWTELFKTCRSKVELVCCFLAILELCRMGRMRAHQHHAFEEIRLFPATPEPAAEGVPA